MALVNLSEAARLARISRVTLYKKYINTGKLSTTSDDRGRPAVDTSELLRVFGTIYTDGSQEDEKILQGLSPQETEDTERLTAEIARLTAIMERQERELEDAREEISWLRARVEAAEQRQLAGPETKRKWWWPW